MKNYEHVITTQGPEAITVNAWGDGWSAEIQLSRKFIRSYTESNGLNVYEYPYGSGDEHTHDLDTYISEELDSIVKHILTSEL